MADVDFGDMLDFLALDAATRGVLLYVESITDGAQVHVGGARGRPRQAGGGDQGRAQRRRREGGAVAHRRAGRRRRGLRRRLPARRAAAGVRAARAVRRRHDPLVGHEGAAATAGDRHATAAARACWRPTRSRRAAARWPSWRPPTLATPRHGAAGGLVEGRSGGHPRRRRAGSLRGGAGSRAGRPGRRRGAGDQLPDGGLRLHRRRPRRC